MDIATIRRAIPALAQDSVYTNTAGFGPLSGAALEELNRRNGQHATEGVDWAVHEGGFYNEREQWRPVVARAFGAGADEVAFLRAIGEGLNIVATGWEWRAGDEVIISDEEHPTGLAPWANLAERWGVRFRRLPVQPCPPLADAAGQGWGDAYLERLASVWSERTKLVAISHVTTETGVRLPAQEITEFCHARGVPVYLDGAQSAGQVALDWHAIGCDFYSCSGSKWLMGPLGTAVFYGRREWVEKLPVTWTGSGAMEHLNMQTGEFRFHKAARKFEFGGRNWALYAALTQSIAWLDSIGFDAIERRGLSLAAWLKAHLAPIPRVRVLTPMEDEQSTGIVTFTVDGKPNGEVVAALRQRYRIGCRGTMHNGVRVSIAFFNTQEELARVVKAVAEIAA